MKHTLESLLALASTDEGKQQIRVMVAEAVGIRTKYFKFSYPGHAAFNGGANNWSIRHESCLEAETCRATKLDWWPEKVTAVEEYEDANMLPTFYTSLDAIMPEVRKLNKDRQNTWLNYMSDMLDPMGELGWQAEFMIATAEAIHHCIALLLTLKPTN